MRQLKISQGITNRGDAAIDKYLTEIGRLELLSMDEEAVSYTHLTLPTN